MERSADVVRLVSELTALSKPNFLIEKDGRFYLALAVLEYDPDAARSEDEKRGIEEVQRLFTDCKVKGSLCACEVQAMALLSGGMNTGPRH